MKYFKLIFFFTIISLFSFDEIYANSITMEENKYKEVLEYFANDSLKKKAALFLVNNIKFHNSLQSKKINSFYSAIDSVSNMSPYEDDSVFVQAYNRILDSHRNMENGIDIINDKNVLTDSYLIKYIESVFEVWNKSWNSDIDFEIFCRYVLPYRVGEEPLSSWRTLYVNKYRDINEKLENSQINKSFKYGIYSTLNKSLKGKLYYSSSYFPLLPIDKLLKIKLGNCEAFAMRNVAQLRSLGIPAALDFTPLWGNRNMGHSWAALVLNDSISIPFGQNELLGNHFYGRSDTRLSKVYRYTFDKKSWIEEISTDSINYIPEIFKNACMEDVTNLYTSVADFRLDGFKTSQKWIYLCTFDNQNWCPISFAKVENGTAHFQKMGKGIVYLPVTLDDKGTINPIDVPFLVGFDGKIRKISCNVDKSEEVQLTRKYPMNSKLRDYCKQLNSGKIQLLNDVNLNDTTTIVTIGKLSDCIPFMQKCTGKKKYKYLKFVYPRLSHGDMADILIEDENGKNVNIINSFGNRKSIVGHEPSCLFDGDPLTSHSVLTQSSGWIIAEFEHPTAVSKISFLPRNDGNHIEKGDLYQLCFWNKNKWEALEEKNANKSGVISFDNVPKGALLLLHNLDKGIQERIFTYENNKQIWW